MSSAGYVRQSASNIASGQPVSSAPVNNEFNALQAAFSSASGHTHDGTTGGGQSLTLSSFVGLSAASTGIIGGDGSGGITLRTITGTSGKITVTNGNGVSGNPTLTIDSAYVGQSTITTLGTIATGVWAGTLIGQTHGGTGVNNAGTLTYGSSNITLTTSGVTSVTLPTSGTLLSSANNLSDVASRTSALTNLLPTQSTHSGQFLTTDGSGNISWASVSGASGGTVTSVTFTGDGTVLSSTPSSAVTASGTLSAALANATGGTILGRSAGTTGAPSYTATPVLGIAATTSGTLGIANGGAGGAVITLKNLSNTSSYNWNYPTTAGSSGQVLTSGGGVAAVMTWTSLAASATTDTTSAANISSGTLPAGRMPALTGDVTTSAGAVTTTVAKIAGTTVTSTTGTTNVVFSASPTLTGTPVAPTAAAATNTTQIATTAFVQTALGSKTSWTPALKFGGASVGLTYGTQSGTYIQQGKFIIAEFTIILTALGSSTGSATITGLPAAANGAGYVSITYYGNTQNNFNATQLNGNVQSSTIDLQYATGSGVGAITNADFTNTSTIQGTAIYIAS